MTAYAQWRSPNDTWRCGGMRLLRLLVVLTFYGCRPSASDSPPPLGQSTVTLTPSDSPIELTLTYQPAPIRLDREVIAELTLTHPEAMTVHLPATEDRWNGLTLRDRFETVTQLDDGRIQRSLHFRFQPDADARLFRLAAIPVRVTHSDAPEAGEDWIATRPYRFTPFALPPPAERVAPDGTPLEVPLPWQTRLLRALPGLVALALLSVAGWWLSKRLNRPAPPPTPAELAFRELADLLARQDVEAQRYKDFYSELTHIVRRYIERAHGIRAPEQTTPEFLAAAARHPAFDAQTLSRLQRFLEAADFVKFAAQPGDRAAADAAVLTARLYIEKDATTAPVPIPTPTPTPDAEAPDA